MKRIRSHLLMAAGFFLVMSVLGGEDRRGAAAAEAEPLREGAAKIFDASLQPVEWALFHSLRQMGFQVTDLKQSVEGVRLRAEREDREIEIELQGLPGGRTRLRAAAYRYFFTDRDVAARILDRTERILDWNFKRGA